MARPHKILSSGPGLFRALMLCTALTILGAVAASATTLGGAASRVINARKVNLVRCDTSASVTYTTVAGLVVSATVDGLADPACEGQQIKIRVRNASGAGITEGGPVTIPADGDTADNQVTIPVSPSVSPPLVASHKLVISG